MTIADKEAREALETLGKFVLESALEPVVKAVERLQEQELEALSDAASWEGRAEALAEALQGDRRGVEDFASYLHDLQRHPDTFFMCDRFECDQARLWRRQVGPSPELVDWD